MDKGNDTRLTRTRSKLGSTTTVNQENADATTEEVAANVNGSQDGGTESNVEVASENTENQKEAESSTSDISVRLTRKRKAIETKVAEEEHKDNGNVGTINTAQEKPNEALGLTSDKLDTSATDFDATESPNSSVNNDLKDIAIGIQTFGKGKRARVPNKRYSDISRFALGSSRPAKVAKNGEFPDDDLGEILREESEAAESFSKAQSVQKPTPVRNKATAVSTAAAVKKPKPSFDLSNPSYLKPFKLGWKRELVFRSTFTDGKRNGDIYYYTPNGKKVRSMREVAENLGSRDLTLDDFTFFKEPLGLNDPDQEIIRDAKKAGGFSHSSVGAGTFSKKSTAKFGMKKKRAKTPSSGASAPPSLSVPAKQQKLTKPSFKVKVPTKKIKKAKKSEPTVPQVESPAMPSANLAKKPKAGNNLNDADNKRCRPCSIRCEGLFGMVPTLQCHLCLCLYHNECVGIKSPVIIRSYVCKNCQQENADGDTKTNVQPTKPPPVYPHSTDSLKSNNDETVANTNLISPTKNSVEEEGAVGSNASWVSQNSNAQVADNEEQTDLKTSSQSNNHRPLLVEYIFGKKYLVVPKQKVANVNSPRETGVANSKSPESNFTPILPSTTECTQFKQGVDRTDVRSFEETKPHLVTSTKQSLRSSERVANKISTPQMLNHMQNLSYGYKTLFFVFQYLKVQDLLRAGCVCTMWRDLARHPYLWRTVRMKNSQIHSFDGFANALQQHGTVHLDLRKMLLPATNDDIWPQFTDAIKKVKSLRRIELCRCLASVVEDLAANNEHLEVINAVTIKCETMTLQPLEKLTNLVDLRLKSTSGLTLTSDLSALKELTKLKHLSITSIKDLHKLNIEVIGELLNLEVLDLGECSEFPKKFGVDILSRLTNLEKLRLEKGHGECHTFDILDAVKGLKKLQQLELVNFDIKTGFDKALGACYNINKLLIIPTYVSQSATTNHMVLGGVLRLQKTLSHFVWGVTLELLRVTELFVDQCEQPDKKDSTREKGINSGDSIPVLKPVPLHGIQQTDMPSTSDTPQVEILPLPNLQKLLLQNLPTTRVKILKIPFHATWRQSITDSVN